MVMVMMTWLQEIGLSMTCNLDGCCCTACDWKTCIHCTQECDGELGDDDDDGGDDDGDGVDGDNNPSVAEGVVYHLWPRRL